MTKEEIGLKLQEFVKSGEVDQNTTVRQMASKVGIEENEMCKVITGKTLPPGAGATFETNGKHILEMIADMSNLVKQEENAPVNVKHVVKGALIPLYYAAYSYEASPLDMEDDFAQAGVAPGEFRENMYQYLDFCKPEQKNEGDTWIINRDQTITRLRRLISNWGTEGKAGDTKSIASMLVTLAAMHAFDSEISPDDFIEQATDAGIDNKLVLEGALMASFVLTYDGLI